MAIVSLSTNNSGGGSSNYATQTENNSGVLLGATSLKAAAAVGSRVWFGLRFPVAPTDLTAANLRQVRLQMTGNNNTNSNARGSLWGHRHAASAAFANTDGSGITLHNRNITGRVRTAASVHWEAVPQAPYLPFTFPGESGPQTLYDILHEILSMPGRLPGASITLIMQPDSTDPVHQWDAYVPNSTANEIFKPELIINYGDTSTDPVELDIYSVGDSTMAYSFNSGKDRGDVVHPLFRNINFHHCAAGMAPDPDNDYLGLAAGGDKVRGYCPGGIYSRELDLRYGEELLMYTHDHAVADSLAEQWEANIPILDGTSRFWGDINQPGSLRYNLANPQSENQVVMFNIGPNDVMKYGANHFIVGHGQLDPETNQAEWEAHVESFIQPLVEHMIDEIYRCVVAGGNDPRRCWVFITGYVNHCVIDKVMANPNTTTFLPDGTSNQYFRAMWCTGDGIHNFLGFFQYTWDVGLPQAMSANFTDARHLDPNGGAHRDWQSSFVRFAIDRQQKIAGNIAGALPENDGDPAHKWGPEEYNPGHPTWSSTGGSSAIATINFPFASWLSYTPWVYNYGNPSQGGAVNTSGWYYGYRNVTDITINQKMGILDVMNRRIAAKYDHVAFADCRNKMSVDTVCSDDPTSPWAEPPWDRFVEGVHLNDTGTTEWINWPGGVLDTLVATIPVMQRLAARIEYLEPGEAVPVYLQGEWNGTSVTFAYFDQEYGV